MCADYLYLKKLHGDILGPAELSRTGVLPEADQQVLDLLSIQSCHRQWLKLNVDYILQTKSICSFQFQFHSVSLLIIKIWRHTPCSRRKNRVSANNRWELQQLTCDQPMGVQQSRTGSHQHITTLWPEKYFCRVQYTYLKIFKLWIFLCLVTFVDMEL